jgi:hypothetical protein
MYELLILVAVVVGIALAIFFLAPNTRNRGVKDTVRVQRTAEAAERQMDYERDRKTPNVSLTVFILTFLYTFHSLIYWDQLRFPLFKILR